MAQRTFVVGDIHGCSKAFLRLLSQVRLTPSDTLYLLGDYVDRGPDSKGVLDAILGLKNEGYDLRPILGNHEVMLLEALRSKSTSFWLNNGGLFTLMSYGVLHPWDLPETHLAFLAALPRYELTPSHVLVHAGLDLSLDDPFSAQGEQAMLWSRQTTDLWKLGGRTLVTGHTPVGLEEIRQSLTTDHIRLDNGCVYGADGDRGNLVALELLTGELFIEKGA